MNHEYFTRVEAEVRVGRRIRTLVAFSGVPRGTTGTVIGADPAGDDGWSLAIRWDIPGRTRMLVDWFSRDEYERYLEEIREADDATSNS
jgi:hypothetical protein